MAMDGFLARGIALIVLTLGILAAPAGASAETFYVDDSATTPLNPCTSAVPANACQTINDAITQARGVAFPGGDTILVAAGSYPEVGGVLFSTSDAGDTIDGAGSGTGATSTVIPLPAAEDVEVQASNITIRDVNIQATSNFQPVYIGNFTASGPSGTILDNVQVLMNTTTSAWAVEVDRSSNTTLNHLTVDGDPTWDGTMAYALRNSSATNTVVNDSSLHSNGPAVLTRDSTLTLNRTSVIGTSDLDQPVISNLADLNPSSSLLTLDSSLVALGNVGIKVDATSTNSTALATIRNSTIDAGAPKNITAPGVAATQLLSSTMTAVGIESSIVVGGLTSSAAGGGTGTMTCTDTDVTNTVQSAPAAISCATGAAGNTTTPPATLFESGFLGLGWHLLPNSPAIDTGAAGALAGGQSATDLDGNARLLDGNFDCVARRDKGAYEVTGQSVACPTPVAPAVNPPTSPTAPKKRTCKKKRKRSVSAARKRSCKKRRR